MVVQMESEAHKTLQMLQRVAELERIVGQKQLEIDFLNKLMEVATEELGYDLKKTPLRSCRVVPLQPVGPRPPDEGRLPTVRHQQAVAPPGAQAGEGP